MKLDKVLSKPWTVDGKTFSQRIWDDRRKLVSVIHVELTKGIVMDSGSADIAKRVAKEMKSDLRKAQRLVVTEGVYFATEAQRDTYKGLGVEKYQILGTLDLTTCDNCGDMDGKVFSRTDMKAGVTAPPFHPNCRCTTVPYFDDEFTKGEMRTARDSETGKTVYVEDMTYKEWREKYVDNSAESGIIKGEAGISKKSKTANVDNTVDLEYINSREYKSKYEQLSEYSVETRNTLYQQAKAMLTHRSKTDKEDMYLIDINSGKVVGKQTASKTDFGVEYSDSLKEAVAKAKPYSLVSIHNHHTNLPPTGSDFGSLAFHKYHLGIVSCHNGKVYWYKVGDKKFDTMLIDNRIEKYNILYGNNIDNYIRTLNEIKEEYNIDWGELK